MKKKLSSGSILFVDDTTDNQQLLTEILTKRGYTVRTALSGREALSSVRKNPPDIILLDIMMPVMDGIEVCRILKSDPATQEIPIIFLTALNKTSDKILALESGGIDYITKPYKPGEVATRIETHLNISQDRRQLQELKLRHQAILEAVPNIIMEVDGNKIYTWANSAGFEFFGEDVIGKEAAWYFEGEQETYEKVSPLFDGAEGIFYVESWQRRKDGEKRLLGWWCRALKNKAGKVTGAISSALDITDRFRAEKEFKENEQKFRDVFENSAIGKSLTTPDGKIHVNKVFSRMTGYSEEELNNMRWQDLTHPDEVERDQKIIESLLSGTKSSAQWEKRYIHKNGSIVWADIRTTLQRNAAGEPLYFITSVIEITDKKRLIESLRESLELYQLASKASFNIIWDWNLVTNDLTWNENFKILLGYHDAEIERGIDSWINRIHPDDLRRVEEGIHRAIDSGENFWSDQYRFLRKDGSYAIMEDRGYISHDSQGKPGRMIGAMEDVTNRVLNEKKLAIQASIGSIFQTIPDDEMFDAVLKLILQELESPFGVFGYIDENGASVIPTMTRQIWEKCQIPQKTFIFPRETWGDSTWAIALREKRIIYSNEPSSNIPEGHVAIARHISMPILFQDHSIGLFQVANKPEDYTKYDVEILNQIADYVSPLLNSWILRQRDKKALITANDNLERLVMQRTSELTISKALLDETGRIARVGGWELDLRTNRQVWTDMVYEIHEMDRDFEPTLENGIRFYAPESLPAISEAVRLSIDEGKPFDLELQIITAKMRRIWVRAVGEAYKENGTVVKLGGVFQDINERKLAEEELQKYRLHLEEIVAQRTNELATAVQNLERSNQDLEQFAYVASHDLQEPLRMVSSYTQLLERRYKDKIDQDANDFIQFAVDGANRMQKLINDLLDYSRITTRGKSFTKTDATMILGQALSNLQQLIAETTALVSNDDLPEIRADESQMLRLFQNLIENAIKFRKESELPRIHISCHEREDCYMFSVKDNGIGIDPRYHDRVFVIFQRLQSKADFPGTGIGLAICKRIVERHGGRIWFESKENEGTTFYFTIQKSGENKNGKNQTN